MVARRIFHITESLSPICETHSHRHQRGGHSTADYLTISCFAADFTNRSEAHLTSELPKQIPQRNLTTTNSPLTPLPPTLPERAITNNLQSRRPIMHVDPAG